MKHFFTMSLFLIALTVPLGTFSHPSPDYHRHSPPKCGRHLIDHVAFVCGKKNFKFPFTIPRNYKESLMYYLPRRQRYTYRYTAILCCRRGCTNHQYNKICQYDHLFSNCKSKSSHSNYTECLRNDVQLL